MCLGDFSANNMKKKTGFSGCVYETIQCVFDYKTFDTINDIDILKYLMKKTWYKVMLVLIKKIFIELLTNIASALIIHNACYEAITLLPISG